MKRTARRENIGLQIDCATIIIIEVTDINYFLFWMIPIPKGIADMFPNSGNYILLPYVFRYSTCKIVNRYFLSGESLVTKSFIHSLCDSELQLRKLYLHNEYDLPFVKCYITFYY